MNIEIKPELSPLRNDCDGVIRIGNTRVTLDTVVQAFTEGVTPEEIALQYPTLDLADIYGVVGFYLRHRGDVDKYLAQRGQQAAAVRQQNEACFQPAGIRERLLARR